MRTFVRVRRIVSTIAFAATLAFAALLSVGTSPAFAAPAAAPLAQDSTFGWIALVTMLLLAGALGLVLGMFVDYTSLRLRVDGLTSLDETTAKRIAFLEAKNTRLEEVVVDLQEQVDRHGTKLDKHGVLLVDLRLGLNAANGRIADQMVVNDGLRRDLERLIEFRFLQTLRVFVQHGLVKFVGWGERPDDYVVQESPWGERLDGFRRALEVVAATQGGINSELASELVILRLTLFAALKAAGLATVEDLGGGEYAVTVGKAKPRHRSPSEKRSRKAWFKRQRAEAAKRAAKKAAATDTATVTPTSTPTATPTPTDTGTETPAPTVTPTPTFE